MKLKHIIIVSLILAILTLSAVSASQDDGNLTVAEETQDSLSVDENLADDSSQVISNGDGQEILGEDERREVDRYYVTAPSSVRMGENVRIGMWFEADNATGNFTFILNDETFYNAPIEWDDSYKDYRHYLYLNEIDLKPGLNNLTFKYTGDENYKPVIEDVTINATYFKVFRAPSNITIYGEKDSTWWTAELGDKTGSVCVLIDGQVYMNDTIANLLHDYGSSDYSFRIYFYNCTFGNHAYNITYYNGKYEDMTYAGNFNVDYYFMLGYYTTFVYPEPLTVTYSLPKDVTGNLTLTINGQNYTAHVEKGEGKFIYNYTGLDDINITATFENEKYPLRVKTTTAKVKTEVKISYSAVYGAENVISLTLPANATGNLTIYKRNDDNTKGDIIATKALVDGKVSFDSDIFEMGANYIIYAYTGNDYPIEEEYNRIVIYPNVTYPKKINNQYKYNFTAVSSDNASGNITIRIYDENYDTVLMTLNCGPAKGKVTVALPDLESGTYIIEWEYSDENQQYPTSDADYLYVGSSDSNWTMNVEFPEKIAKYDVGNSSGTFKITNLPEDIEGDLVLYVDGNRIKRYDVNADKMEFDLSSLSFGYHTWELRFYNSDYYTAQPVNGTFEIVSGWIMNVEFPEKIAKYDISWPSSGEFKITNFPNDIEGDLVLYVDGNVIETYDVVNDIFYDITGSAEMRFDLSSLSLGNHTWELRLANSNYIAKQINGTFELMPYKFPETIEYDGYEYALSFDLNNKTANAILNVLIDGKDYKMVQLKEGKTEIPLNDLPLGEHTYELVCTGDVNVKYTGTFDVKMAFIDLRDYFVYSPNYLTDVQLGLPDYANGIVTLTVNNKNYTSKAENGIARFDLSELALGKHLLVVKYSGDDVNPAQEIEFNLTINRYDIQTKYDGSNLIELSIILPKNATGNLSIYNQVDSSLIKTIPLVDGKASFKIEDELNFGLHEIRACYESENGDYDVNQQLKSFVYGPKVTTTDIHVGENATVTVDFKNATGNVTVILNDEEYANVTIQNGKINMSIPYEDLASSRDYYYTVSFIYHGTDFDPEVFNQYGRPIPYMGLAISKEPVYPETIPNGEIAYVTVELPDNSEGYAVLHINGNGIDSTYNMTYSKTEKISMQIPILPEGEYWFELTYYNAKYNRTTSYNDYFTVLNPEPALDIVAPKTIDTPAVIFNLPEDVTGNLIVNINGKNYGLTLVNGSASISIPDLKNGEYEVNVIYSGDDNYTGFNKTVNVTVKNPIDVDDYDVETPNSAVLIDSNKIKIGMWIEADNPTGNFTFILNGEIFYNAPIEWDSLYEDYNHYLFIYEMDLKPGINNLTFKYTGDENYKPVSKDFTIDAYYFKTYIIPKNIKIYGENDSTWWTSEVGDKTGSVCVLVDGEVYMNDTIENLLRDHGTSDYTFRTYFYNCPYGDHTYNITYYNGKYEDMTYTGEFNVDYYFEVGYYTFVYPEPVTVTLYLPTDVTGNIPLTINGQNCTAYVKNGRGTFIYNYTELEDLNITVTFENEKYPLRVKNITAEVEAKIKMESYAVYGTENVISLTLPADATGNLTIYKRNDDNTKGDMIATKALVDGKVSFDSDILNIGINRLIFEYTGNDYPVTIYNYNQITIYPNATYPEKINKKDNYNITIICPDNSPGNLTMALYDEEWETVLMTLYNGSAKGKVTIGLPDLESGTYILEWAYNDENQPRPLYQSAYLYVGASDSNLTLNVEFPEKIAKVTVIVPSDGYFHIIGLPDDIEGEIVLYVDGKRIQEYDAIDYAYGDWNTVFFSLSTLSLGNHTWKVRLDDYYYTAEPINGTFELIPYDFPETIEYDGSNHALYFDLNNKTANAFLNVLIDGKDYKMVQLKDGRAEIPLNDLPLGEHTYELVCTGDVNAKYTCTFDVKMAFINIKDYYSYYYGELNDVELGLPDYANGIVTLTVNGKDYTSKAENGVARFDLSELNLGKYMLIVKYSGDDINPAQEIKFNLSISRYSITPVYDDKLNLLEFSIVLPSNATGNLNIYNRSNSKLITSIPLVDGKASFKIEDLSFGSYNLTARYESENGDYTVDERSRYFVVTPPVNITDVHAGEDATIYIDFKNATGIVTVILNREEYVNATIQDGKINMTIPYSDLAEYNGYYFTLSFVYHGNDFDPNAFKYGASPILYHRYILDKPVYIPKTIHDGEIAYATAELPENAEGYAVLKIQGNGMNSIYNMTYSNTSKISLPIPVLPAGEYWIDFTYYNAKYDRRSGEGQYVTVLNPEPALDIVAPTDTKVPELIFNLPEDATGSLIVNVNGQNYGFNLVNGSANITIPGLDNGKYEVKVTYSGDAKYSGFDKTFNVTVDANQYEPKVVAGDLSMIYSAGTLYKVTVWGANGKLASNVQVTILINGKVFKTVKTNAKGIISVKLTQKPGTYKITSKALGKTVTKKLTVKHVISIKKVKVKRSAKKLVIKATLKKVNGKYLKNKKITFKFKGKKYTAKTNKKGVAKVTIKSKVLKKLKVGKKVTYKATYLKDTVKKTVKVKK